MTTQQQIIDRLSKSRKITGIRQEGDTVHYTFDGKPYRIEQTTGRLGLYLRLVGPTGILYAADNAEDICDFILI